MNQLTIPEPILTERLQLRVPRAGDGREVNTAIRESFPRLHQWMHWAQAMPTVADTEAIMRTAAEHFLLGERLGFSIYRRDDGQFAGGISLHHVHWEVPSCEIGYWLRTSLEGHGYITEAVNALVAYAFERMSMVRVELTCDANNTRSAAVAQRAGFALEGRLRHHRRTPQGQLADTLLFARIRAEDTP